MRPFRTLHKGWLHSFTSLLLGETRVREQAAEFLFSAACQELGARDLQHHPIN
jgi:hypothetical protein